MLGAEIILGNTYHLHLRPGDELIARAGGLHRFIGWDGPILTDSGGYQVFSLARCGKVDGERRRRSGRTSTARRTLLTPEIAADIQAQLGSDIAMVLDECIARRPAVRRDDARDAMERRHAGRGAPRRGSCGSARDAASAPDVVVPNPGRRSSASSRARRIRLSATESVAGDVAIGFEAYAIGGLSVGEPVDVMYDVVAHTAPQLPADRPRYLMGTGMPDDLVECVARGIDMFDCVLPTRNARNGQLFTRHGVAGHQERALRRGPGAAGLRTAAATRAGTSRRAYLRHLYHGRRDDGRDPEHAP